MWRPNCTGEEGQRYRVGETTQHQANMDPCTLTSEEENELGTQRRNGMHLISSVSLRLSTGK